MYKNYNNKKRKYSSRKNYYSKPYSSGSRWNNSLVTRAVKSIKECNKSNSSIDFAFKINYAFTSMFDSSTKSGVTAINLYNVLLQSQNFRNMALNWDQVKINGCQARLNICDAVLNYSDINQIKSINVITGWDRTGLSLNEITFYEDGGVNGNPGDTILKEDWDDVAGSYFKNNIGEKIAQGYGCKKGLVNSYQRFSRYESIYPQKLEEKACYVPTSTLETYENGQNPNTGVITISDLYSQQKINDQISQSNPCIPFENSIKWKPTLLVGVFSTTIERTAVKKIPNPKFVTWNNEHPNAGDCKQNNNIVNREINSTEGIIQALENLGIITPPGFTDWTGPNSVITYLSSSDSTYVNATDGGGVLSSEQAGILNALSGTELTNAQTSISGILSLNKSQWQIRNNPFESEIVDPNSGGSIVGGQVSQYGSVNPIVFNGEFTIAVTFNQQKGDV